ncbi:unnamed protein product [Brassicogethes aeneus]|uniref:Myb/SANT-like DNA-binding domain-containing protein n=1 Tax=Brassicogethes aeneus TaxID=1431903 RepID=A0A9P0FME5_BRAAE|nr:unnamed protein product [Brassicogethes aeneus]
MTQSNYLTVSKPLTKTTIQKKENFWNLIATELESLKTNMTSTGCLKKWQNLLRTYKVCKDAKSKTGRGPTRFNFFEKMDGFLGSQPNNSSPHSIDVQLLGEASTSQADEIEKENNPPINEVVNSQKWRKNATLEFELFFPEKKLYLERKEETKPAFLQDKQNWKKEQGERRLKIEEEKIKILKELLK